jgi:hypothetical protein
MIGRLPLKFPAETLESIPALVDDCVAVSGAAVLRVGGSALVLLSIGVLCGAARPLSVGQSRILFAFLALCLG